jgi:cyclopropane fatty-acyl-phospholipid synthase-like methyltransferase
VLHEYDARNLLDVGCAEGWFVRRAATDLGIFAIGIESTDTMIVGELARLHDRTERAGTLRAFVTPEVIRALPKFDAVLCLSVLHHVIRAFGIGAAEQYLRALASRVGKVLLFEIGTAAESSWSAALPAELGEQQEGSCGGFSSAPASAMCASSPRASPITARYAASCSRRSRQAS